MLKARFGHFKENFWAKNSPLFLYYSTLFHKMQYFFFGLVIFGAVFLNFPVQNASAVSKEGVEIASTSTVKSTNVNDFSFSDFTADYYLYKADDGTSRLKVIERFTAEFPSYDQNRGIVRLIPFTNQDGHNLTMPSTDKLSIRIKHNGIEELPYEVTSEDGYFRVMIRGDAYVHGTQYYELTYEFQNVITEFSNFQELYWDTNGNDWQQRFDKLTARLHIDEEIFDRLIDDRTSCYVGRFDSKEQEDCEIRRSGEGYEFLTKDLWAGENLTFAVDFEPGTFKMGEKTQDYSFLILVAVEGVMLLVVVIYFFVTHEASRSKREFYKNYFIKPEYQPAKGFSVAEMATNYIGTKSSSQIKVASLLEMAVQGKIALVKIRGSKNKWQIQVKKGDLSLAERNVLQILAGKAIALEPGVEITIKRHTGTSELMRLVQKFPGYIRDALAAKGLSEKKPKFTGNVATAIATVWIVIGLMVNVILLTSLPPYYESFGGWPLIAVSATFYLLISILGIMAGLSNNKYFSRTRKGLEYSRYMDGLKLYVKMAEAERLRFLQSVDGADTSPNGVVKLYEKLLPYAIVFGEEKSWLNEMGKYYEMADVKNPAWYHGDNTAFNAIMFSSAINSVVRSTESSIRSTYSGTSGSSSGSFGGGGGGFSGGGGGGGGGGGC